jgi:exodeoxyribonuclease V alpha subunit
LTTGVPRKGLFLETTAVTRAQRKQVSGERLKGELVDFVVRSADHWGTGVVRTVHDGGNVKISGKMLGAKIGDTVELEGFFDETKWGRQFKVRACEVVIPTDASGVIGWLASNLPQISKRRAEELVQRYGVDGVWRLLEECDYASICEIDGITHDRAKEIFEAYKANKADRDRVVRFKSWGLTDGQIGRVLAEWGNDAEAKLQENPYLLIKHVDGFGWTRADAVAMRMGVAKDSPARIAAGILDVMSEATVHGNVYVPFGAIVRVTAEKKCGVPVEPVESALRELLKSDELVCRGPKVYLPKLARAELKLATFCARRAKLARMGIAS